MTSSALIARSWIMMLYMGLGIGVLRLWTRRENEFDSCVSHEARDRLQRLGKLTLIAALFESVDEEDNGTGGI